MDSLTIGKDTCYAKRNQPILDLTCLFKKKKAIMKMANLKALSAWDTLGIIVAVVTLQMKNIRFRKVK